MKSLALPIVTNAVAVCLQVMLSLTGNVPPGLTIAGVLVSVTVMIRPVRVAWATIQFKRGSARARRSLDASDSASLETEAAAAELQQCIARAKAFKESVEAGANFTEEDRNRQLAEIGEVMRRVEAARNLVQYKQAQARAAVDDLDRLLLNVEAVSNPEPKYSLRLANGLVSLAVLLAGPSHAYLADAWHADMIGAPEDDLVIPPRRRLAYARGLVYASLRIRAASLVAPLWRPVDWLLSSTKRVDTAIAVLVGALAIYLGRNLHDLLTDASGPCALAFALLKAGATRLRRMRGIELAGRAQAENETRE